jgi:fimbrial chaperone protein
MIRAVTERTTISRACARLICVFAAALLAAPAIAGSLQVDPVKVEISKDRKVASVRITNEAPVPVTIRAHAVSWAQANGEDVYGQAPRIILSPPIFTIAPGAKQLLRIGLRTAATPSNYRLILEELPQANRGAGIQVALRLNLPVYVLQKQGSLDELAWAAWQQDGTWIVEAANRGAGYVRIEGDEAAKRTGLAMEGGLFGTVLPGSTRRWAVGPKPSIIDRAQFQRIARKAGENDQITTASTR